MLLARMIGGTDSWGCSNGGELFSAERAARGFSCFFFGGVGVLLLLGVVERLGLAFHLCVFFSGRVVASVPRPPAVRNQRRFCLN